MKTRTPDQSQRLGLRSKLRTRALSAVLALAALAVTTRSTAQTPTFNTQVNTPVTVGSGFPEDAAVGDINGDGKLDVMIPGINGLRMLLGNGNATFVDQVYSPPDVSISNVVNLHPSLVSHVSASPRPVGGIGGLGGGLKAVDVNRDGKLDLVAVTSVGINFTNYSFVSVMINTGANDANGVPVFTTTHHWCQFLGVRPVTVGDLNGDNWPDFVIGTSGGNLQVWTSNGGTGTFTPGQVTNIIPIAGGPSTGPGVIVDLNGDGKADLVTVSAQAGATDIFYGNGDGTLQTPSSVLPNNAVLPGNPASVAVADVNGDGRPDLLVSNLRSGSEGLQVYLNNGGGVFSAPTLFAVPGIAGGGGFNGNFTVVAADINGDGKLDAMLSVYNNNVSPRVDNVAVLLGDGNGGFGAPTNFPAQFVPTLVYAADFTNDGKTDIGVVLRNSRSFGVLTNTTPIAPPAQSFFTDSLATPSTSPNLTIPAPKYQAIAAGLQRVNNSTGGGDASSNTDRPMVTTRYGGYLGESQFTATLTMNLSSPDIAYFGFGRTDADPNYFQESANCFLFRVHRSWTGYSGIQVWPTKFGSSVNNPDHFFNFVAGNGSLGTYGGSLTLVIRRNGDSLTMSIPATGASHTFSISQFAASMGLNGTNARIFFGSTNNGTVFSNLSIVPGDTTPPVIAAPANITTEATSAAGAVVTFSATATDDTDGNVPVVAIPPSGSVFPLGTTTVDLGTSDAAGNQAFAEFNVTVRDTTPPAISAPADIIAEATSAAGASVSYSVSATDIVDGNVPVNGSPASGSTFALGATNVALSASDSRGNSSSASFTVTVQDTTAPVLSVPASQILEATSAAGATATFAATATDAVGVASITYSAASGSTFALGTTTVTVTASDAAGNSSSGSFTITVRDTTAPTITSLSTNAPTLWPPNHKMVAVTVSASASDLVGIASLKIVSVTSNEPDNGLGDGDTANDIQVTGDLTVNLRAERSGKGNGRVYTITVEARDAAGNATTRAVAVTVPKSQGK